MTEQLVTLARTHIEDESTPYMVTEPIIMQKLNAERQYLEGLQIFPEDYDYSGISTVYMIGYKYIMNLVLTDGEDNVIPDTDYDVDVENGIVTFDASPVVIPDSVYAKFTYHDFMDAVAELWLYQMALSRFSGRVKLGDEDLPMDKSSREYCLMKYWAYKQSKNIQMER